jgi:small subunit ribosomal protein S8
MRIGLTNFILGQCLSIIRSGILSKQEYVFLPKTKFSLLFLTFLYKKGLIFSFRIVNEFTIQLFLKYWENRSVIKSFKIISVPSKRIYVNHKKLDKIAKKKVITVISTHKGIYTALECLSLGVGGEVLCLIHI